jgi:replicative DNA helicase
MMAAVRLPADMAPAHDLGAEAALLAAVLLDPSALVQVRDTIDPKHFYAQAHGRIYAAALRVVDSGLALEATTVVSDLRNRGELATVGGPGYVVETIAGVDRIDNPRTYAEIVHTHWRQREAVRIADELAADGREVVGDVQSWLDGYRGRIDALTRGAYEREVESNHTCLRRMLREMLEYNQSGRGRMGLSTGLEDVDTLTLGLRPGRKYTVAALPGRGKTAFGIHVATVTAKAGFGVLFLSLEMGREELLQRMMASHTGINGKRILTNQIMPDEWPVIIASVKPIADLPIVIESDPSMHVGQVAASVRRWSERMPEQYGVPLGLVVVDYLQRLSAPPHMQGSPKKHEVVAHTTKALKTLAQETGLPVLELAQQKSPDKPTDRPGDGCVADSREVDKESDVLAFLHRCNPKDPRCLEFIAVKQRNAEPGLSTWVDFDGATQRFGKWHGSMPQEGGRR